MPSSTESRVLLVGWDAADWRVIQPLLDAGKMPVLERLVGQGVMGNLATLQPPLSPMLWTSIATGKRPMKHRVLGFCEPTHDGCGLRPVSSLSRKCKAVWNILSQSGLRSLVVGWWPSHPVEPIRGVMVSNHFQHAVGPPEEPWPVPQGAVHPPELARPLAQLRVNPNELAAEHILPFIPRAAEIDQDRDKRLASVARIIAECTTVHAVTTWLMEHQAWDFCAVYYDAIDHFCHGFMRYHPPRQRHIDQRDFELYQGVVEAGYRYHDMMLGRLLELAGDRTTVILVSDHGFHPDHLRPATIPDEPAGPAVEHRDFGIFAMKGPGIKQDELVHGLNLLDITPTILHLLDLPVGEDMDGHVAVAALERPRPVRRIASWEEVDGEAGMHPPERRLDALASHAALQQLVALGYVEPPGGDPAENLRRAVTELKYNLARSYMDAQQHAQAAALLEQLYEEQPDQHRFGVQLAFCYRALNRVSQMRQLVQRMYQRSQQDAQQARRRLQQLTDQARHRSREHVADPANPGGVSVVESGLDKEQQREIAQLRSRALVNPFAVEYLMGFVALAEGNAEAALEHLQRAEQTEARRPGLHLQIGEAYLALNRVQDAQRSFRRALELDGDNPHAHLGLARCHLRRRKNRLAAECALRTIWLCYHMPMAHFCLGVALHRMGRVRRAVEALRVAVSLNPHFPEAHQRLAYIYQRRLGDITRAEEHRRLAAEMRSRQSTARPAAPEEPVSLAEVLFGSEGKGSETATRPATPICDSESAALRPAPQDELQQAVTVVSGLPRSGTSMLMRMLAAGGMPVLSDNARPADEDNPYGYFELEQVKRLPADTQWLDKAKGKAVKVIAQLVPRLPPQYHYRVLLIQRDLDEVLASQAAMLARQGRRGAQLPAETLKDVLAKQQQLVRRWLADCPFADVLQLQHRQVIQDPASAADAINRFLGGGLDCAAMAAAVDPRLYRQTGGRQ